MRRLPVLAGLVLGLVAAGCGIPLSSSPRHLPSSALPAALIERQQVAPNNNGTSKGQTIYIYLVASSGDLVQVARTVSPPATPQEVLYALEAGPFSTEYHDGYESAVSGSSHLVAEGPVRSGTLKVRLDRQYSQLSGETPVEELAQIVWSLTASNLGVKQVQFVSSTGPVPVEIDTGVFVNRPVKPADYLSFIAQGTKVPSS